MKTTKDLENSDMTLKNHENYDKASKKPEKMLKTIKTMTIF